MKATLPSSLGGLNVRVASLHAPAALIGSLKKSRTLVAMILGHTPRDSFHAASSLDTLANSAGKPGWCSLEDVDIPVNQKALSHAIDRATFDHLLSLAPDTRSKALALSTAISHAGDWLTAVPSQSLGLHLLDREFRTCLQYWLGIPMLERGFGALGVSHRPICMVITRLVVGEMGTESIGITPSGTHYILQLNWLLWRPGRKCLL